MVSIQECLVRGIQVFVFGDRITRYIMWYDILEYRVWWYPNLLYDMISRWTRWDVIEGNLVKWYPDVPGEMVSLEPGAGLHVTKPLHTSSFRLTEYKNNNACMKIIALRLYKIIINSSAYADEGLRIKWKLHRLRFIFSLVLYCIRW